MKKIATKRGFTLIEILVVIGIIAVLAAIVIIAINPARQFAQARNSQRQSNIDTILNAIGQNLADNKGVPITATTCVGLGTAIGTPTASTTIGIAAGNSNLNCLTPTYISAGIPQDPTSGTAADTKYQISVDANGRYMVCAPLATEAAIPGSGPICVTR